MNANEKIIESRSAESAAWNAAWSAASADYIRTLITWKDIEQGLDVDPTDYVARVMQSKGNERKPGA